MLPTPISIITITSVNYNRSNESLDLSIKLTPPEKPFGFVTHYEVVLHTSLVECFDCISSDGQRFLVCKYCQVTNEGILVWVNFGTAHG